MDFGFVFISLVSIAVVVMSHWHVLREDRLFSSRLQESIRTALDATPEWWDSEFQRLDRLSPIG